jgi:hypothetical protein
MPVALSRGARALFKACLTGEPVEDRFNRLYFYEELERKGLVTLADGGSSFHLTEEGEARRWEFLPHPDGPSEEALALLCELLGGGMAEVCDENRSAYRELAAAGIMDPLHTFAKGDESAYRFTEKGWASRYEWANALSRRASSPGASPALRG